MIKQYLQAGKIIGAKGLHGEVVIECWCDTPNFLSKFKKLYLNSGVQLLNVRSARVNKNTVIMFFDEIKSIEEADELRNEIIYINRDDVKLEKDCFFIEDLLGLKAIDADSGKFYGKLTDVFKTGANDVYNIKGDDGKDYLVPVIEDVVLDIDIKSRILKLRPLKGIFEDGD